jgi:RimJ/RimL family protein N-acetyltransferase
MLTVPHPYEDGVAEEWIASHGPAYEKGERIVFALASPSLGLIGAMGLILDLPHQRAELGYWIGQPYWNQGYATEALEAVLKFGFETLKLNKLHARHMTRNPASGRVMQKVGMWYEGRQVQHIYKWGQFEDLECYALLREQYERHADSAGAA